MSDESTMRERMIERLFYALVMVLLAKWGGVATDVAIHQSERVEVKQERGDMWRQAYAELVVEHEQWKEENCP